MAHDIETQRTGYLKLIELCVGESKQTELTNFIHTLKNYNGDENFVTTLNYVVNPLDRNGIQFIMALDWKQEVRDLVWRIESSLRDNFNLAIELPDPAIYGERASVSYKKNVFRDFDNSLKSKDFKIGFVDTDADEYVIIVHQTKNERAIEEAVNKIGYNYLDADSPKINNVN